MKVVETDVCVIGAGAGGTGCVWRLIKNGINTVVVDKNPDFGGTMVFSGVDGWEPGVSLDGIHSLLVSQLESMENACHVVETVPNCNLFRPENGINWENHSFSKYPWGLSAPTGKSYADTLGRCTYLRGDGTMKRFQFEAEKMSEAINAVFAPYKDRLTTFFGYAFLDVKHENRKITSVTVTDGEQEIEIKAKYFVDSSGDIVLARKAGCAYTFGSEGQEDYDEPGAGKRSDNVNAVTYVFRVSPTKDKQHIDEIPQQYLNANISAWKEHTMKKQISCFTLYPNNDININMLPTMESAEYFSLGDKADYIGKARVYAYWNFLQREKNMKGYTLTRIFNAGIRESYRLVGRYVLTENDARQGILRQPKKGRTVAIADHALDIHGKGGMIRELVYPYEIPLDCTRPREFDNLFVACRGASFSHIASASARLTRTMLSLGEGVGEYVAEMIKFN